MLAQPGWLPAAGLALAWLQVRWASPRLHMLVLVLVVLVLLPQAPPGALL